MYNEVDMGVYLTNLVNQIANSFDTTRIIKIVVHADGVLLDIQRGTPAGLIINEFVTNSYKYAFPESFDTKAVRGAPPTITITLSKNHSGYVMTVGDNGIGLPPGFDLTKTKTLGLKLANFLAKHQMRAEIEVNSQAGTEFIIRFPEK
jgi:two-component sensor histidine kinase